jgi:hypothetical protein
MDNEGIPGDLRQYNTINGTPYNNNNNITKKRYSIGTVVYTIQYNTFKGYQHTFLFFTGGL